MRNTTDEITTATMISVLISATNTSQTAVYYFKDTDLFEERNYYYWLENSDLDGQNYYHGPNMISYTKPDVEIPQAPVNTELGSVYPNPFNPNTVIPISLKEDNIVSLQIYNNRGQLVKKYDLGHLQAGSHRIAWDGCDESGKALPSGMFHIKMLAGANSYQVKAVLMK